MHDVKPQRRRSFFKWGFEDEGPDPQALTRALGALGSTFGADTVLPEPAREPTLADIDLRPSRITAPTNLAHLLTVDPYERARHTYGRAYRDLVRALTGDFTRAPDVVAFPGSEADVAALLDFAANARVAVIPFGGGSSVCGGVEADVGDAFAGTLSLDLRHLGGVRELDVTSRAARIGAGAFGPDIEDALRPHGLTLRHYPQSFEHSTLGGWLATRSGGHFATLHTQIDDFVESMRVCTGAGLVETRRLPRSGAGPSPERMWLGSEGILGIITEAWMRLRKRPRFRASAVLHAPDFIAGGRVVRALAQSGLHPSNLRLLDPLEAFTSRAGTGAEAVLLVAFEAADHAVDVDLQRALTCARDAGATVHSESVRGDGAGEAASRAHGPDAAEAWRHAFLRGPYLRDALVQRGFVVETFETAITWDRFDAFHIALHEATLRAAHRECGAGLVTTRVTHAYPDGAAPYYTVIAPAPPGRALAAWDAIKAAVTDTILEGGGTVTHHHAVGRDLRPFYARERAPLFARALHAQKAVLDPAGILNPGVLL